MPTRDARHGRLYVGEALAEDWRYIYIEDDKHIKTSLPLDENCDCPTCARYSIGYLHHLFKIKDIAFQRLATLHNLRFMARLVSGLAEA
jgi:queuine tRNA-ribosyltransferase